MKKNDLTVLTIHLRVIPNAPKTEWVEQLSDGTLKLKLKAPPVEGKANAVLIAFLAKELEIPQNAIQIILGEKSKNKIIQIFSADSRKASQELERIRSRIAVKKN